ncbi:MAG: hypothetical protein WC755_06285 [Candidatus Woesearchaeota archaeon]|jgi:hypothetical protein
MILCYTWTTPDTINFFILIVYVITAFLIYRTFNEGRKQTKISLSINQFNIFYNDLKDLIEDAENIKYKTDLGENANSSTKSYLEKSNGINYIGLFQFTLNTERLINKQLKDDNYTDTIQINDFRQNIIFPLGRYYDRLLYFLNSVDKDDILQINHKKIIYNKVERDILQTYFRVCNYQFSGKLDYNLSIFDTDTYKSEMFYRINKFYINKNLFQYKDLEFYCKTT